MIGLLNLAIELAGLHQPPPRRDDYTALIGGQSFGLSDESDEGQTIIMWTGKTPACPSCHQPLTTFCDDTTHAPVVFVSAWVVPHLECDFCGARIEMRDAR